MFSARRVGTMAAAAGAVGIAAVWVGQEPRYAVSVEPRDPRAGQSIRMRTTAPEDESRGLYVRMERRDGERWVPVLDLAPEWEATGPPHAKPTEGDEAAGLLKAFPARGVVTLVIPQETRPGRYRLRQRLLRDDLTPRDLYAEVDVRGA